MIIIYFLYISIIDDTFTFKDYIGILQYIESLLPAEPNINKYSHVYFWKLHIPLSRKSNRLQRLPQNKKTKGGVKLSWKPDFNHTKAFYCKLYAKQLSSLESKNKN